MTRGWGRRSLVTEVCGTDGIRAHVSKVKGAERNGQWEILRKTSKSSGMMVLNQKRAKPRRNDQDAHELPCGRSSVE